LSSGLVPLVIFLFYVYSRMTFYIFTLVFRPKASEPYQLLKRQGVSLLFQIKNDNFLNVHFYRHRG